MATLARYREIRKGRVDLRVQVGWEDRVPLPDRRWSWGEAAEPRKAGSRKTGFRLPAEGGAFLVKEYRAEGLLGIPFLGGGRPPAFRELDTAIRARLRGLPVALPVAAGLAPSGMFGHRSFLVSFALETARPLDDLLLDGEARGAARRRLLERYGALARRAHDGGFQQEDFDPNNAICLDPAAAEPELRLVDMERVVLRTPLSRSEGAWSLARLLRYGRALPLPEQIRFLRGYVAKDRDRRAALRSVARLVRQAWKDVVEGDQARTRRRALRSGRMFRRFRRRGLRGIHRVRFGEREPVIFGPDALPAILAPFLEGDLPEESVPVEELLATPVGEFELTVEAYPPRLPFFYSHARWAWLERNAALRRERMEEVPIALVEARDGWPWWRGYVVFGRCEGYRSPTR